MQARLLAQLRDEGPLSKAQLADLLQVSRTTIGAEVARLGELGLAVEAGPAASRGGRRSTLVDLSPDIRFAGISIGATGLSVGVTDGRLTTLAVQHRQCDIRQGPEVVLALALEVLREVMAEAGVTRLSGAGVGVPGPVDFHRGVSVSPPIMPGWDGYPVRDAVSRDLGCPVVLDNDVNVLAVGEQHAGVARAARDFLFVKIGTGIGCGIVVDGELYRGVDGCAGRHRAHPGRRLRPHLRVRQHRLPGGVRRRRRDRPRRHRRGPRPGGPRPWPRCSARRGS